MKFYIETYGCQMNVADSELVSSILVSAGWLETDQIDDADLLIFNTCTVRKHAEDRVLGRITNEKNRKKAKPSLKIMLIGCLAQSMGEKLLENSIGIDYVVGVDNYREIPELLSYQSFSRTDPDNDQIYPGIKPLHKNSVLAFVTIMRGCNNFCSYCIVPHVRGRERSVPPQQVLDEIKNCGLSGRKDITLLGQNVNSYRSQGLDFPDLLEKASQETSVERIRFLTSHPKDVSDKLISIMAMNPKICEHIHLPLQSGSDNVLHLMNRKYTLGHYLDIIRKLRSSIPNIAITTDLIAGFPGETEVMFNATLDAMRHIEFDYAFCFKYSERSGTSADSLPSKVPEEIRLKRLQMMVDLQSEITLRKFRSQIGRTVEVYAEGFSRKSSRQVSGKTRDFKIAVVNGTSSDIGTLIEARVVDATSGTLICES